MPRLILRGELINRVYQPHLENAHRYQIYFGGSGSGKSVFLATRCVLDALRGRNILVVRKVARTLRGSCWNETVKAIERLGLKRMFSVSKSENTITVRSNGAQILFAGLDDVEKIKSITPARGNLTDIWMEEATECTWEDFKQLDKRLRGQSRFEKRITLSFNPVWQSHWIWKEFFSVWQDGKAYAEKGSVSILKTTYRDNRFLTADDRAALEGEKDPYFYRVYTLGEWGVPGHVIFTNWKTEDLTQIASRYPQRYYGLDFGFSADPCGAVECALDRRRRIIYVFHELCEKGLTNLMLAGRLRDFCGVHPIACDSAEPKSIAELKSLGIRAFPAKKGPDSVIHGVQWLQGHEIIVSPECEMLRQELSAYQWRRDAMGRALPEPEDQNNHLLDALRYALESESQGRMAHTGRKENWGL